MSQPRVGDETPHIGWGQSAVGDQAISASNVANSALHAHVNLPSIPQVMQVQCEECNTQELCQPLAQLHD
jgi:hypothetical protein